MVSSIVNGSVEVSLEGYHYHIKPGDVYIYMASTLVHLLHKSEDAEGIMVEVDFYYILPIVNKVINVESQLFMRKNPCVSLSDEQCAHFEYLLNNLWDRINAEDCQKENVQYQHLKLELIKSMGQTICYEILNMYFTNQPLQPLQQGKKMLSFRISCCLCSVSIARNVTSLFMQGCSISLPVISTIIKEKTGDSALQWIVRMVITEAKQLLEESDLSIKEIADQLNFPTQSFFGKYFKQYVGVSPKEYRNNAATTRIKR